MATPSLAPWFFLSNLCSLFSAVHLISQLKRPACSSLLAAQILNATILGLCVTLAELDNLGANWLGSQNIDAHCNATRSLQYVFISGLGLTITHMVVGGVAALVRCRRSVFRLLRMSIFLTLPLSVAFHWSNLVTHDGLDPDTKLCNIWFRKPGCIVSAWIATSVVATALLAVMVLQLIPSCRKVSLQVYFRNMRRFLALALAILISYGLSIFCALFAWELPAYLKLISEFCAGTLCWELVVVMRLLRIRVQDRLENDLAFREDASVVAIQGDASSFGQDEAAHVDDATASGGRDDAFSRLHAEEEEFLSLCGAEFCLTPPAPASKCHGAFSADPPYAT